MSCVDCPCPGQCLARPIWCQDWAPSGDPVKRRHICDRSRIAAGLPTGTSGPIPLAESLDLVRSMRACPFHSTGPGCGCSGSRCALRGGRPVSHVDCFGCIRQYGP